MKNKRYIRGGSLKTSTGIGLLILGLFIGLFIGYIFGYSASATKIAEYELKIKTLIGFQEAMAKALDECNAERGRLATELLLKTTDIEFLENKTKMQEEKIAELEEKVKKLQSQLVKWKELTFKYLKEGWNVIKVFKGKTDKTTPKFFVPAGDLKIKWRIISKKELATFSITLYKEKRGYDSIIDYWFSLEEEPEGEVYAHSLEEGYYYLKISAWNVQYEVTVEVWISKD